MPTVTISSSEMVYQEKGEGFPVIFGHSYLWDSNMWAPQLEMLSKKYRCIAPDLWDHGRSGHLPSDQYTIERLAEDYWQFIQALNIDACAIVGLSVGGMWATELALRHPETVQALVIMDTYVGPEPAETQAEYFALLDAINADQGISKEMAEQLAPYFFSPKTLKTNPQLAEDFKKDLVARDSANIPGVCALGRAIFSRQSLLDQLSQIKQPTLVVVGEDDLPRPPSEAQEMANLIPGAQLEIISDSGHICNLEKPQEVTAILDKFLVSAESRSIKM